MVKKGNGRDQRNAVARENDVTNRIATPNTMRSLRIAAGVAILVGVVVWIALKGTLLRNFNPWVVFWSATGSAVTSVLNAQVLRITASAYKRQLSFRAALHICLLGSFGNALGGLPIGTTLKYVVLHRHVGLTVAQITAGLAATTAGISLVLLGYAAAATFWLDVSRTLRLLPSALIIIGTVSLLSAVRWSRGHPRVFRLVEPLLTRTFATNAAALSLSMATVFVANATVVGAYLVPEQALARIVFISSAGILLGLGSLLQTVGGIQELALGIAAYGSGVSAVEGAQIALAMRISSISASAILLGLHYLMPSPTGDGSRHPDGPPDRHGR